MTSVCARSSDAGAGAPSGSARQIRSSLANAAIEGKRCAGSFASARCTAASSRGDTSGRRSPQVRRRPLVQRWRGATATKVLSVERDIARQHLPQHDAERVDVGRRRHAPAARLLGREVLAGAPATVPVWVTPCSTCERARDAEVGDLDTPVAAEEDVLCGLHVAVDQPALVREGAARVVRDVRPRARGPAVPAAGLSGGQLLEVLAVDVLERRSTAGPRRHRGR